MAMSEARLLGCPFCEKAPADFASGRYDGPRVKSGPLSDFGYMGNRTCWFVACHCCCMVGPHSSEADAIAAWNRRATNEADAVLLGILTQMDHMLSHEPYPTRSVLWLVLHKGIQEQLALRRPAPPVAAEGVGQSYQRNIDGGQTMAEGVRYNNGEIPPTKESQP